MARQGEDVAAYGDGLLNGMGGLKGAGGADATDGASAVPAGALHALSVPVPLRRSG
jgi:hypothetical protein